MRIEEFETLSEADEKPPVYHRTKTGKEKVRDSVFGSLKGGQEQTTGIIDFALIGSAFHKGEFIPNPDSYGMVLMDECHPAASAQGKMQSIRAKYVYGMTAAPNRSDRRDKIIFMHLGPLRHKYTAKEPADAQGLDRFVMPGFTRTVNFSGETPDIH